MKACRICGHELRVVVSFGETPLANALKKRASDPEERYPLDLCVCDSCFLVQLSVAVNAETLFGTYSYATPKSVSLSKHYMSVNTTLELLGTTPDAFCVEIGSNTGEFLRQLPSWAVTTLGVEPAVNIAKMALDGGAETLCDFFNASVAKTIRRQYGTADLIAARHCFAHIDDLHEIMEGVSALLSKDGIFYIENAYLMDTCSGVQYDQIYHEHMSYISVTPVITLLREYGLKVIHVERAPVHGGSILIFATRDESYRKTERAVDRYILEEYGLMTGGMLDEFAQKSMRSIAELRAMVESLKDGGRTIDTYGASAKGNTLLNVCGLTSEHIRYALDGSPLKWSKFLPGSSVPVVPKSTWNEERPDYAIMTAWNYESEILDEQAQNRRLGTKFIVPVPEPRVV